MSTAPIRSSTEKSPVDSKEISSTKTSNGQEAFSEKAPNVIPYTFLGWESFAPSPISRETADHLAVKLAKINTGENEEVVVLTAPNTWYGKAIRWIFGNKQKVVEELKADLIKKYTEDIVDQIVDDTYYTTAQSEGLSTLQIKEIYCALDRLVKANATEASVSSPSQQNATVASFFSDEAALTPHIPDSYNATDAIGSRSQSSSSGSEHSEIETPFYDVDSVESDSDDTDQEDELFRSLNDLKPLVGQPTAIADPLDHLNHFHSPDIFPEKNLEGSDSEESMSRSSTNHDDPRTSSHQEGSDSMIPVSVEKTSLLSAEEKRDADLGQNIADQRALLKPVRTLEEEAALKEIWEISGRYRQHFEKIQNLTQERASLQKEIDALNGEIATAKLKLRSSLPSLSTRLRAKEKILQDNKKTAQNLTNQRNQLFAQFNAEIKKINPRYSFDVNGNLLDEHGKTLDLSFTVTEV